MKRIIRAEWIAPMDSPIIRDGAVAFSDGRIVSVGSFQQVNSEHPDAELHDLGDAIVLPGLVNPHTHLELSHCKPSPAPQGSFVEWILSIRAADQPAGPATQFGVEQSLKYGVTCVGDISQQADVSRPIIGASKIRCVSYGEVIGLAKRRGRFDELLPRAIDRSLATSRLKIGLSPHAPYTVDLDGYRECLEIARREALPLATHLAENPDERDFIESHSGIFRELWETLGYWQDGVPTHRGSPIAMAKAIGLLDYPTLLAHVNYCLDEELDMLARGQASVVYCPRTHAYFGHPPHRWREMLARGINVAVGTDSCASSPDLNLVEELRLLRRIAPDIPALSLWEMATVRAARALGMQNGIGGISRDKFADFTVFKAAGNDPLKAILQSWQLPMATWIGGEPI
jgi:cytosine/adenosine deaminase-related metal-dependent hydrolase